MRQIYVCPCISTTVLLYLQSYHRSFFLAMKAVSGSEWLTVTVYCVGLYLYLYLYFVDLYLYSYLVFIPPWKATCHLWIWTLLKVIDMLSISSHQPYFRRIIRIYIHIYIYITTKSLCLSNQPTNQFAKEMSECKNIRYKRINIKKQTQTNINKWMENHALPQPTFCTENDLDENDYDAADVSLCWLCIIKTPFPCYLPW